MGTVGKAAQWTITLKLAMPFKKLDYSLQKNQNCPMGWSQLNYPDSPHCLLVWEGSWGIILFLLTPLHAVSCNILSLFVHMAEALSVQSSFREKREKESQVTLQGGCHSQPRFCLGSLPLSC